MPQSPLNSSSNDASLRSAWSTVVEPLEAAPAAVLNCWHAASAALQHEDFDGALDALEKAIGLAQASGDSELVRRLHGGRIAVCMALGEDKCSSRWMSRFNPFDFRNGLSTGKNSDRTTRSSI